MSIWSRVFGKRTTRAVEPEPLCEQEPARPVGDPVFVTSEPVIHSTIEQRRQERVDAHHATVEEYYERDLKQAPIKAQRATVRGKHYIWWVKTIEQLKRDGELQEALDLLMECIQAAERDRGNRAPAPWYSTQGAIVARKLGYISDEVAIIRRYLGFRNPHKREAFEQRLAKAEALLEKKLASGMALSELQSPPSVIRGQFLPEV